MIQQSIDYQRAQAQERDAAIDSLRRFRSDLIAQADAIARRLAISHGTVTSTQVLAEMRSDPNLRQRVDAVDCRFMGPVFRQKCWVRVGWEPSGSHCRPVSVWRLY